MLNDSGTKKEIQIANKVLKRKQLRKCANFEGGAQSLRGL